MSVRPPGATKSKLLAQAGGNAKPSPEGYNALNAEAYGVYRENEFRSPLVAGAGQLGAKQSGADQGVVRNPYGA